jgi:protein-tyrosine phosphatase
MVNKPASFEGIWNLRDLGGHAVNSGGVTRSGQVFRCGTLWFATSADCAALAGYQFDTFIDLRLPEEELAEQDWLCELLDTRQHHLPIRAVDDQTPISLVHPGGAEHYARLLDQNAGRYVKALEVISDPANHPIMFHCAAGVDRSGVLAALVLACLGVEDQAIVDDYTASSAEVAPIVAAYRDHRFYGDASADTRAVDSAAMEQFLSQVGGAEGLAKWALANGFTEASLGRLRKALIEP